MLMFGFRKWTNVLGRSQYKNNFTITVPFFVSGRGDLLGQHLLRNWGRDELWEEFNTGFCSIVLISWQWKTPSWLWLDFLTVAFFPFHFSLLFCSQNSTLCVVDSTAAVCIHSIQFTNTGSLSTSNSSYAVFDCQTLPVWNPCCEQQQKKPFVMQHSSLCGGIKWNDDHVLSMHKESGRASLLWRGQ